MQSVGGKRKKEKEKQKNAYYPGSKRKWVWEFFLRGESFLSGSIGRGVFIFSLHSFIYQLVVCITFSRTCMYGGLEVG